MSHSVHIAAALIAGLLVLRPVDCFSATGITREAVNCCKKGKCVPTKDSDDCCRGTVPDGQQFVGAGSKSDGPSLPVVVGMVAPDPRTSFPTQHFTADLLSNIHSPPGSSPTSRVNLPLLI